jgi:signal transduction histidine kinase/HAMP domain-containing protein
MSRKGKNSAGRGTIIMTLTLRSRIFLTLAPLFALLAVVGGAGGVLLYQLGGRIDEILRENYESVVAMERLNEALERIDSSFQFTLAGKEDDARRQYKDNWTLYWSSLRKEQENITLPGEQELVDSLTELTDHYHALGNAFYARPGAPGRDRMYFGDPAVPGRPSLFGLFDRIKKVSGEILRINHENMKQASREARHTADTSLLWFGLGLTAAAAGAVLLARRTVRVILQPIQAMSRSALAIGGGNLDQVVAVPARDELGQLAEAFNGMARQLRDYRQSSYSRLLRAQRTSQATIDSFPDPVLVVDSEGRVEMANPAAQRQLGVVPRRGDQEAGPPWRPPELLRQPLAAALRDQHDYLPEGFDRAVPLSADGQSHSFLPRIRPIRDPYGLTLGAALLLQDVTRFRLLDQVKSDLVATVSHELKTPLTSIRLAVHLLAEETLGALTPKQMELVLDARENAERMLAIINNLLDLARLERGQNQLDRRPWRPAELLQAAADAAHARAADKGVELTVEAAPDLPPVAVDGPRFGHALNNLLDNAVTYTDRGGRVTLAAARDGDGVAITVADTGGGIPPEFVPHIFERFFRVPGRSRPSGLGLGLAIVHEIVTAHGGTITCESTPGAGTVFRLTLPAWKDDGMTG